MGVRAHCERRVSARGAAAVLLRGIVPCRFHPDVCEQFYLWCFRAVSRVGGKYACDGVTEISDRILAGVSADAFFFRVAARRYYDPGISRFGGCFPGELWGGVLFVLSALFLAGVAASLAVMLFFVSACVLFYSRALRGQKYQFWKSDPARGGRDGCGGGVRVAARGRGGHHGDLCAAESGAHRVADRCYLYALPGYSPRIW